MKNKKKIAVLYSGGFGQGGIETYLENLFREMKSEDLELTLFTLGTWKLADQLREKGYNVKTFSGHRINPSTVFRIAHTIKSESFSLIVSNGNVATAYGRAVSFLSKVPNLATVHSDMVFDYPNPLLRMIYQGIDRATRFQTTKYITVSKFLKDTLITRGVSSEKIEVIYNGVALLPVSEAQALDREGKKFVIRSVGRLHYVKGFHNLIEAIAILDDPSFTLEIAGEGDEHDNLERLIRIRKLNDKVRLVGHVGDPVGFIGGADVYVQPSLSEGFGLAVVDAMFCGTPVVVTPAGSLPEIVRDRQTGLVAKDGWPMSIALAIKEIKDNKKLARKIAEAAKLYASVEFSVDKWLEKTAETYRKAAK